MSAKPEAPTSFRKRPEWWAVIISVLSLACSIFTFFYADYEANKRGKRDAALGMCAVYTSGDGMRSLVDAVFKGSIPDDKITNDQQRTYKLALESSVPGVTYKHQIMSWMNFLSVVANGLDNGIYDVDVIRGCFASSFATADKSILGPIFPNDDYPEIHRWALRLSQ
jgi:hypothetical protein